MSLKKGVLHFFYITKPFNTARISPNFTHLVIASTLHIAIIRLQKVNQNNPLLAAYPKQRLEFAWFWYLGIPLARGTPSQLTIKLVRNRSQVRPGHYQDYLCHPGLRCWIIHTATKQPFSWPFILSHSQVPTSSSILVE